MDQPSPEATPRVNYSLLVMESAGMMKMATGEGSPLRQCAGTGSRLFLVATEACGGGTPDLGYVLEVWGYIRSVGVGNKSGGSTRRPRGRGRAQGGSARPATSFSTALVFPEGEGMMQQSSVSISLSF